MRYSDYKGIPLKVTYKLGREMHIADALSKAYLPDSLAFGESDEQINQISNQISPVSFTKVKDATLYDPDMRELHKIISED